MQNLPPPVINKPQINETSELFNQVQIKLDLAYNNINYILEIGFNKEKTEIVFLIDEEGKLSTEFYLCKTNLESAKKLSKYFLVCDSIDQMMETLKYIGKNTKQNKKSKTEYKIDFSIKDNNAFLKYSIPLYTGENLRFEFILQKKGKNKDLIIEKLKERIKEFEDGYYEIKKEDENKIQNEIRENFKKIRSRLNIKEKELLKKSKELNGPKSKQLGDQYVENLIKEIDNISFNYQNYPFKWKNGPNYTLDENRLIAEKTSGGNNWNCAILGDKPLPKNSIVSWEIKLKNFTMKSGNLWDVLIGIAPDNLDQKKESVHKECWTFICGRSRLALKSCSETNYKTGKLKTNDIVEVIMDTSKGILSFSVNGNDYGIACNNITNDNLYPIVMICDKGESIELIQ